MFLNKISLLNFKNFAQLELVFHDKINCLVGNNGVGKTNLLDAIYYLSFCKSYFNTSDNYNIKHHENFMVVQGKYTRLDEAENIYCGIKKNQKKVFKRNAVAYKKLSEHIGLLPLIMISPNDSKLITEGSSERRKLIDASIAQLDNKYLNGLINYNKALAQRNSLLKNFAKKNYFDAESLELWNDKLIQYGQYIFLQRKKFIDDFLPLFKKNYKRISKDEESVEIEYISQLNETNFADLLSNSVEKDRNLQFTTQGIHKDDLAFKIENYLIKRIGSQGQQKTFLAAIKFAQFEYFRKIFNFPPLLLLDDIFDKLDSERVREIVNLVSEETFGQVFITDTNPTRLQKIFSDLSVEFKLFGIEKQNEHQSKITENQVREQP